MAQLSDDCFAFGGKLTPIDTALGDLLPRLVPLPTVEEVPLTAALGRILAAPIVAGLSVPPLANSAVDGYAFRWADLSSEPQTAFTLAGRAAAGHPAQTALGPQQALRIFTGAPLPDGADTVMMQEDCRLSDDGGTVFLPAGLKRGANARSAGEDVAAGDTILAPGQRLRPAAIGLAASIGLTRLPVYRPLRVGVFSTGDEIADPPTPLRRGQQYDANRHGLIAALQGLGCDPVDLGLLPDQAATIRATLVDAAGAVDALLTSGGMSEGEEDHVRAAIAAVGSLHFWRLAIKPGRPVALGQIGRVPIIGLPGNPAAALVTFAMVARPVLLALAGVSGAAGISGAGWDGLRRMPVRARFAYRKKSDRREYVRVRLHPPEPGDPFPQAERYPRDGAGILSSMVWADGLVELPEDVTALDTGVIVSYVPLGEVGL